MAQKFNSPGVYATEVDQSFLNQGSVRADLTLIGRALKGPAYIPVRVDGFDKFQNMFGGVNQGYQLSYAAKNYLRNAGAATVVRVLGHADGTGATSGYTVGAIDGIADFTGTGNGVTSNVLAVVHHSGTSAVFSVAGVAGDANNFVVSISPAFSVTASFLTSSVNYIGKVMNFDPTKYSTYGHYVYRLAPYAQVKASASWTAVTGTVGLAAFNRNFESGSTSFVTSQPLGGNTFNLFRFHTVGHGRATNDEFKVMIANVRQSPSPAATAYGTFDVVVRSFGDTDQRPVVLETFVGLNLDPTSPNYIARRIGDSYDEFDTTQRKFVTNGIFPANSARIRVEMKTDVSPPAEALPWGFRGYQKLNFGSSGGPHSFPTLPLVADQFDRNGNYDGNITWGAMFASGAVGDRMKAQPDNAAAYLVSDSDFTLAYLTGTYVRGSQRYYYVPASGANYQPIYASASLQKFQLPFNGGFDGWDLRVDDKLYLTNSADETDIGVVSLKRAIDCVSNPDVIDMSLLAIPGIHNLKVTDYARAMANNRRDVFYVMDLTGSSVAEVVGNLVGRNIDDNYAAAYYPDVKIDDKTNNRVVRVSPSTVVVGALAFNDRVGQPWFAPAGFNRGGLKQYDVVQVADRLSFEDRDELYINRINPIGTFPAEGIVIVGQKTLQVKASALDRVNVRRLLIFAKKVVSAAAKLLLFEPNNASTWQRFTNAVNPILDKVRQDQGVDRFKVVMDSNTNTPDVVDRNIMVGKIFLQPTRSAEFIDLSFIITNSGVEFGN